MKAFLIAAVVKLWILTLRYRRVGPTFEGPGVIAFWHGDQLPLLRARPAGDVFAPISLSRDGRLQAQILWRLGIGDVPGSSSRGAFGALRGLLRVVGRGGQALIAVDGPRGPRGEAKPGGVHVARRLGVPIWPVGVAVQRGARLRRAWDRFLLPLPFTRIVIRVGEPLYFDQDSNLPESCQIVTEHIHRVSAEARSILQKRP